MNTQLPKALCSRNPITWLGLFGPGAVIASLTIGAGELIFSSRGGSIFGLRLLWYFVLVLLCKWVLVYGVARQIILTGQHPFQRWMSIPGPHGWFCVVFLILAIVSFPIWVAFHAGTAGTLLAGITGTSGAFNGAAHYAWGSGLLILVLWLISKGGYERLEKLQLAIVICMLFSVVVSLFLLKPDWWDIVVGLLIPRPLAYPDWIVSLKEFSDRPVWVEVMTYVGVIGGSGYDYLAYGAYLREKQWGAADGVDTIHHLREDDSRRLLLRRWLRAPLVDCTLSFIIVLVFSGVFVVCGSMLLRPAHQIPAGANLLALQAQFVGDSYPWLKPLYFVGAFLTMFGTLYGTIEVAPAILREMALALGFKSDPSKTNRLRRLAVGWCGLGGLAILAWSLLIATFGGAQNPPGLVALLTPANLFTGVLACGIVCASNLWVEHRFMPRDFRADWPLRSLTAIAAVAFLLLGFKAYWDHSRWVSFLILGGTLAIGYAVAWWMQRRQKRLGHQELRQARVGRGSVEP